MNPPLLLLGLSTLVALSRNGSKNTAKDPFLLHRIFGLHLLSRVPKEDVNHIKGKIVLAYTNKWNTMSPEEREIEVASWSRS